LRLDLLNHGLQRQLGIPRKANINGKVLVDVFYTLNIMDDHLSSRDRLTIASSGHAGADGE
jgi:hypothetical protein